QGHLLHIEWLRAAAGITGASILVRMEDHDRSRCRPEFELAIIADLLASGLSVDQHSLRSLQGASPSPFRQGDNPGRYQAAFDRLREMGLLYGCTCTRGDLGAPDEFGERHYAGTCRGQPVERECRHV